MKGKQRRTAERSWRRDVEAFMGGAVPTTTLPESACEWLEPLDLDARTLRPPGRLEPGAGWAVNLAQRGPTHLVRRLRDRTPHAAPGWVRAAWYLAEVLGDGSVRWMRVQLAQEAA